MQELTKEKTMSTKEVAEALGLKDVSSITRAAKKCLPNKVIQNGKTTYWTEKELTALIAYMKTVNNRTDLDSLRNVAEVETKTSFKNRLAQMAEKLSENSYEEQLAIANLGMLALQQAMKRLEKENENLKRNLDESEEWCSLLKYCAEHDMSTDLKVLRSLASKIKKAMALQGLKPVKIPDSRYPNGVNSYPREFLDCYFAGGEF